MGGIAGIIRFDGRDIDPAETDNVIRLLKHRGVVKSQPIKNGMLISFGGNIETKSEASLTAVTDAEVFFTKFPDQPFTSHYMHGGPAAFNELNADFVAVLWDEDLQVLCCARDILGLKPLYYIHIPHRFFAFASEIKGLTVLEEVLVKSNRHQFREYLVWTTSNLPYSADTFYENIYSVLPGHYLKVSSGKIEETAYWKPRFQQFNNFGGIECYADAFKAAFTDAIAGRLKNKGVIGAHLSGGLDSSSVSCVAQSLLTAHGRPALSTFNIDTQQRLAEEQSYVQDVVNRWHTDHFKLKPLQDVLDAVLKINKIFDRPEHFIIPSSFHLSVSEKAQSLGCDTILTGQGGDNVAISGFSYLDELMDEDKWDLFHTASEQYFSQSRQAMFTGSPNGVPDQYRPEYEKLLFAYLTRDFRKRYGKWPLISILSALGEHKTRFGISNRAVFTYLSKKLMAKLKSFRPIDNALRVEFRQQLPHREQRSTAALVSTIFQENHINLDSVLNHHNVICNEQMNHIGASYGHLYSNPFFDKNVIEICLSMPVSLSFDGGRGRGLIRHGMQHVLPESVLTRTTKADFVEYGTLSAQQLYNATREQLSSSGHPIWEIVDRTVFLKIVSIVFNERISSALKTRYNWQLSRIVYLSIWLKSFGKTSF